MSDFNSFPAVRFEEYMPCGSDCVIVHTTDPTWSALLERHCEGELTSPDGRTWRRLATFLLNGVRREFPALVGLVQEDDLPWKFQPWSAPEVA